MAATAQQAQIRVIRHGAARVRANGIESNDASARQRHRDSGIAGARVLESERSLRLQGSVIPVTELGIGWDILPPIN
jgi:hypothetical protein